MSKTYRGPDMRNIGGLDTIIQEKLSHRIRLLSVKSTVDTSAPKSWLAKKALARPVPLTNPFLRDFMAPSISSSIIDSPLSSSIDVDSARQSLSEPVDSVIAARLRKTAADMDAHAANLENMRRRIMNYSSMTELKKNFGSPQLRSSKSRPPSPGPSSSRIQPRRGSATPTRPSSARSQASRTSVSSRASARSVTSLSARPPRRHSVSRSADSLPFKDNDIEAIADSSLRVPEHLGLGAEAYIDFKQRLLTAIIDARIYKRGPLLRLFDRASALNRHLDPDKASAALNELKTDLDMEP